MKDNFDDTATDCTTNSKHKGSLTALLVLPVLLPEEAAPPEAEDAEEAEAEEDNAADDEADPNADAPTLATVDTPTKTDVAASVA